MILTEKENVTKLPQTHLQIPLNHIKLDQFGSFVDAVLVLRLQLHKRQLFRKPQLQLHLRLQKLLLRILIHLRILTML